MWSNIFIGNDIVEIERVRRLLKYNKSLSHIYTDKELSECVDLAKDCKVDILSKKFVIKEAVVKALGTGFGEELYPKYVEVIFEGVDSTVTLHNYAKSMFEKIGATNIYVSTSISERFALSFVVIT